MRRPYGGCQRNIGVALVTTKAGNGRGKEKQAEAKKGKEMHAEGSKNRDRHTETTRIMQMPRSGLWLKVLAIFIPSSN